MVTANQQPLDQQLKAFRQSSSFTPGDTLCFSIKFTEGPDGLRVDTGGKLRGEFSLRRMFGGGKKDEEAKTNP